MEVDVVVEDARWTGVEALAAGAVEAVGERLGVAGEVVLLACDAARSAALNGAFRGKAQPTNVLSWPSEERAAAQEGRPPTAPSGQDLGDIALSYETCLREAAAQGKRFDDHVTHLIVHGVLHLLGYDHERSGDAALMERLEIEILGKMGISDPYSAD
ncbi:MAG: rRNA maturation RNase YbeY [Pseudomonadota bacterium]